MINCSEKKNFFRTLKPFCKYLKPQIFLNKLPKKISIRDSAAENINMRIENCVKANQIHKVSKFKLRRLQNQTWKKIREKTLRLATSCILVHIYQIIRRNKSPLVVRKFSVFLLSIDVHHQNKVFFSLHKLGKILKNTSTLHLPVKKLHKMQKK